MKVMLRRASWKIPSGTILHPAQVGVPIQQSLATASSVHRLTPLEANPSQVWCARLYQRFFLGERGGGASALA